MSLEPHWLVLLNTKYQMPVGISLCRDSMTLLHKMHPKPTGFSFCIKEVNLIYLIELVKNELVPSLYLSSQSVYFVC